jgi:hypothetical protein
MTVTSVATWRIVPILSDMSTSRRKETDGQREGFAYGAWLPRAPARIGRWALTPIVARGETP